MARRWITSAELRGLPDARPSEVGIRKAFASKAEAVEERQVRFRITTDDVDRERDVIASAGWRVQNFLKNPVVLWAHSYRDLPIGRSLEIERDERGLVSLAEFTTAALNPLGDTVYRMVLAGFLNAVSVGFQPDKWAYNEQRRGIDYMEQDLLEYSVVPVPANQEALVEARQAGIDTAPIRRWAEAVLDLDLGEPGLWVPRSRLEALALGREDGSRRTASPRRSTTECPRGTACPNTTQSESCPAGRDCPVSGAAESSARDAEGNKYVLTITESEAPPEDAGFTREDVETALRVVVQESIEPALRRHLRQLTGRLD